MNNNVSAFFINRPVATTLLTIGIAFAGAFAFDLLPVSPLPQVDFPTISVQATMPGGSPDTMASSVASPLEKHLGQIADVTEMTSSSSLQNTRVTLQFGLDRDINGAARDVQAAINAARADLPTSLRSNPTYHKVNPSDLPIMIVALTSPTRTQGQLYDAASNVMQQRLSQVTGIGEVDVGGSALPAVRVELNPTALFKYGVGLEDVRASLASANANSPKGAIEDAIPLPDLHQRPGEPRRSISRSRRRLSQQRRHQIERRRRGRRIRSKICAMPGWRTASRRCWSFSIASLARISSKRSMR